MLPEVLLQALNDVWQALGKLNAPKAIIGGLSMAVWRRPRATRDIDILIGIDVQDIDALIALMRDLGAHLKREPLDLGTVTLIQVLYGPPRSFVDVQVDLLVAKADYHRQALRRTRTDVLFGTDLTVSFVACEDLILLKLLAGRVIDQADARAVLAANVDTIDGSYLAHWADELGLLSELRDAWSEAAPSHAFPAGH